jgi:hypothetical protein
MGKKSSGIGAMRSRTAVEVEEEESDEEGSMFDPSNTLV